MLFCIFVFVVLLILVGRYLYLVKVIGFRGFLILFYNLFIFDIWFYILVYICISICRDIYLCFYYVKM